MTSGANPGTLRIRADAPRALTNTLENNLARVRAHIEKIARDCGRDPGTIGLVAVTKTVGPEVALALARLGAEDLGENRVDELQRKASAFRAAGVTVRWHFVGHVQTNKAAAVAEWGRIGAAPSIRFWNELLEHNLGTARARLDAAAVARAEAEGRAMPFDRAVEIALGEPVSGRA